MSIRKKNITFASTGQNFDLNKNDLGEMTSLFLTPSDFSLLESELNDIDALFNYMLDGKIFPIHRIFSYETNHKEVEYKDALQDFSFRSYRGKDIFKVKYDIRVDYHQLLQQFQGHEMRLIIGVNNNSFLCTESGTNVRGYLLSNITLEDIEIFNTNLSPLRIELANKTERDSEKHVKVDYRLFDLDRRILSVSAIATTNDIGEDLRIILTATFNGVPIDTLVKSDISINDDINGNVEFEFIDYLEGTYKLEGFDAALTKGCLTVTADGYIGRNRYSVTIRATYDNYVFYTGDNYVFMTGDNYVFIN